VAALRALLEGRKPPKDVGAALKEADLKGGPAARMRALYQVRSGPYLFVCPACACAPRCRGHGRSCRAAACAAQSALLAASTHHLCSPPPRLQALLGAAPDSERLGPLVAGAATYLSPHAKDAAGQLAQLVAAEWVLAGGGAARQREAPLLLKAMYDADLADEELVVAW
jgi:hypothetical protein